MKRKEKRAGVEKIREEKIKSRSEEKMNVERRCGSGVEERREWKGR